MTENQELLLALKELKKITGMTFEVNADNEEELNFAIHQIQCLCTAYKEKYNKIFFLQSILNEKISAPEICKQAPKFHISLEEPRALYLIETKKRFDDTAQSILKHMFPNQTGAYLIPVSETELVLLNPCNLTTSFKEQALYVAHSIIDTLNMEAMITVKVSCSLMFQTLSELPLAFQQAKTTLKIGKAFHLEQNTFFYDQLGIDRLVYHLPLSVCDEFLNEIWDNHVPDSLDAELYSTISCFMQNNLNIAETARQLHMHRNTLIYRIEKIQTQTGLDIRKFEDAMTFKIAVMVMNYKSKIKTL